MRLPKAARAASAAARPPTAAHAGAGAAYPPSMCPARPALFQGWPLFGVKYLDEHDMRVNWTSQVLLKSAYTV